MKPARDPDGTVIDLRWPEGATAWYIREHIRGTDQAMDTLLHALGLDENRRAPWRDYYTTDAAGDPEVDELVAAGLMEERLAPSFLPAGSRCFGATAAGRRAAVAKNERRNPPPSMAKRRYLHWLRISDVCDITFADYLRRQLYNDPFYGAP